MKSLVTSKKFSHMSIASLHHYAKRKMLLHCCDDTWYKYIARHGWKRPQQKNPKERPRTGAKRANSPNEIIHIDVTQIKIVSGVTYYLQIILDNFSRFILAWRLCDSPLASNTASLIQEALIKIDHHKIDTRGSPYIVSDQGSENLNSQVAPVLNASPYQHPLHRVDFRFSNNMLEVFFRSLKNNYLNHHPAKSKQQLYRRIKFYVNEHNKNIPQSALGGSTAQEAYLGTWHPPPEEIKKKRREESRIQRIKENRTEACASCWES